MTIKRILPLLPAMLSVLTAWAQTGVQKFFNLTA